MDTYTEKKLQETTQFLQAAFASSTCRITVKESIYDSKERVESFTTLLFHTYIFNWIADTSYKVKPYKDVAINKCINSQAFSGQEKGCGDLLKQQFNYLTIKHSNYCRHPTIEQCNNS